MERDKKLTNIKEKIKRFFKKVSSDKDTTLPGSSEKPSHDESSRHLYRDDLKMY